MIIVFGAAGFIGTYLVDRLLNDGYDVLASDIEELGVPSHQGRPIPFVQADLARRDDLNELAWRDADAVVNLACIQPANVAQYNYSPQDYVRVNVLGNLNILECCRQAGVPRLLYTSSHRNTQGLWQQGKAISEDSGTSIQYSGEYAMFSISESAASDCIEHYNQAFGMRNVIFRLPPVYGYGPHTEIFKDGKPIETGFKIFIERAQAGLPIEIWGDAKRARDIVYVKDVVTAIVLALRNRELVGLYNIASGRPLSLEEEVRTIAKVFASEGREPEIILRPDKPNSVEPFLYDIGKAKRDFGWQPQYSFEDMLWDYRREMESGRFDFLLEKRRRMLRRG